MASDRPAPHGSSPMWVLWPGSPTVPTSLPGPAPPSSTLPAASTPTTGCPAPGTAAQPRALHGWHRSVAQRHPRSRLLPPPDLEREDLHGGDALPAPPPVRCGLPAASRRHPGASCRAGGPGRALRGDSVIQRGRSSPGHRHFGPATSRTRTPDAPRLIVMPFLVSPWPSPYTAIHDGAKPLLASC